MTGDAYTPAQLFQTAQRAAGDSDTDLLSVCQIGKLSDKWLKQRLVNSMDKRVAPNETDIGDGGNR